MCDYSLASVRTRLASEGEELVIYRFPTGSLGLASPAELEQHQQLRGWRSWFSPRAIPCAVCIPPGARLLIRDLPPRLQSGLGTAPEEEVVFVQTGMAAGRHRDAIRFRNHQEVLLQRLVEGQRVQVLSLALDPAVEEEVPAEVVQGLS